MLCNDHSSLGLVGKSSSSSSSFLCSAAALAPRSPRGEWKARNRPLAGLSSQAPTHFPFSLRGRGYYWGADEIILDPARSPLQGRNSPIRGVPGDIAPALTSSKIGHLRPGGRKYVPGTRSVQSEASTEGLGRSCLKFEHVRDA